MGFRQGQTAGKQRMQSAEHLSKAPIREAVIDIRTDSQIPTDQIKTLEAKLPAGYGELQPTLEKGVNFTFKNGNFETNHKESLIGFKSENKEHGFIVQFQSNGLCISKLAPYQNWDTFKQAAMELWEIYKLVLNDFEFKRVAVRYINEIHLPFTDGKLDFDRYMANCPKVPEKMPDQLLNFLNRIVVPYEEISTLAVITQNISDPVKKNEPYIPYIIDIDVYRDSKLDLSESEIWAFFDQLRDIKNHAFNGSITEETKELCR